MNSNPFIRLFKNESGVALLITLSIIAILLTVSMELNRRVKISILAAETGKTNYQLMEMARSGLNIAMALLAKDAGKNQIDSIQEEWSDPEALNKMITSLAVDEGDITLKIMDEMGKLQVNALIDTYPGHEVNPDQRQVWETLLSLFINSDKSQDKRDPQEIINCLIDWLDDKDGETITGISGAETPYYESLKIPYKCANREFFDLNELFFVKGISNKLLLKAETFDTLFIETETREDLKKELQLKDLFTVFGAVRNRAGNDKRYRFSGKININTAPIQVIAAILPFGKQDLAENICDYRQMKPDKDSGYTHDLSIKNWYARVAGLTDKETEKTMKMITYSSDIFSIESHAVLNGRSLVLTRVVERQKDKTGKWFCKTLRQQMD